MAQSAPHPLHSFNEHFTPIWLGLNPCPCSGAATWPRCRTRSREYLSCPSLCRNQNIFSVCVPLSFCLCLCPSWIFELPVSLSLSLFSLSLSQVRIFELSKSLSFSLFFCLSLSAGTRVIFLHMYMYSNSLCLRHIFWGFFSSFKKKLFFLVATPPAPSKWLDH